MRCSYSDKTPCPLTEILSSAAYVTKLTSDLEYTIPFTNTKYRSNVRVIDYFPHRLEDFAIGRRMSDYDVLSDYSGGESTDNEGDMQEFRNGKGFGAERKWEWRFAFQIEDAQKKSSSPAERGWLIVDNLAAQMLLKMDAVK